MTAAAMNMFLDRILCRAVLIAGTVLLSASPGRADGAETPPICDVYKLALEAAQVSDVRRACGVAQFLRPVFVIPHWTPLDPREHMALVQEIVFWTNTRWSPTRRQREIALQMQSDEIMPTLFNEIWGAAEPGVQRLLAEKRIILETAMIDIDGDGAAEQVYRMSRVFMRPLLGTPAPEDRSEIIGDKDADIEIGFCGKDAVDDFNEQELVYFVPSQISRAAHRYLTRRSLQAGTSWFLWGDDLYAVESNAVFQAIRTPKGGEFGFVQQCAF